MHEFWTIPTTNMTYTRSQNYTNILEYKQYSKLWLLCSFFCDIYVTYVTYVTLYFKEIPWSTKLVLLVELLDGLCRMCILETWIYRHAMQIVENWHLSVFGQPTCPPKNKGRAFVGTKTWNDNNKSNNTTVTTLNIVCTPTYLCYLYKNNIYWSCD